MVSQEQNWGREGKAEDSRGREGERAENSLATWENGDQKRIPTCAVKNEVLWRSRHTDGLDGLPKGEEVGSGRMKERKRSFE